MNTGNLSGLVDIVMPAPVSWWPPAPGWIWATAVLVCLGLAWSVLAWRRWRQNAYRREALAELEAEDLSAGRLFEILKRVALVSFDRSEVAGLSGENWIRFLAGSCRDLEPGGLEPLYAAVFSSEAATASDLSKGLSVAKQWIRKHRLRVDTRLKPGERTGRLA